MKKAIFVLLATIIVISIVSVGSIAYLLGKQSSKSTGTTPSPQSATSPSPNQSQATASPVVKNEGTITGTLGYPSEFIPKGRVKAQNINTKEIITTIVEGLINNVGTDKFTLVVPAGTYYLKYEACADPKNPNDCLSGYYTTNDGTAQNQPHDLISVKVKAAETTGNIKISDFYGAPSQDPGF